MPKKHKKQSDQDRYEININAIGDSHFLIVVKLKEDVAAKQRDFAINIKPGGYCLRKQDAKTFEDYMNGTSSLEALLAFLEVYDFRPRLSPLERDILNYWKYRRLEHENQ